MRREDVVLVGGGVCSDPAEGKGDPISNASPNFGEREIFEVSEHTRLADKGFGDEESWREGSTGSSERLGFGE